MIPNYIIYRYNCAWRYLDRHGGNPTVGVQRGSQRDFLPFSLRHQQSSHIHALSAISAYSLHELYWILHGITIARDLRLRRFGCRRHLQVFLLLDIRNYCTTWQDTRYFNVDQNFLTGTKDATKVVTMIQQRSLPVPRSAIRYGSDFPITNDRRAFSLLSELI